MKATFSVTYKKHKSYLLHFLQQTYPEIKIKKDRQWYKIRNLIKRENLIKTDKNGKKKVKEKAW
jgi:hypothetical protein